MSRSPAETKARSQVHLCGCLRQSAQHHAPGVSATLSFLYRGSNGAHSFPFPTLPENPWIPTGNESAGFEINRRREIIQQQEMAWFKPEFVSNYVGANRRVFQKQVLPNSALSGRAGLRPSRGYAAQKLSFSTWKLVWSIARPPLMQTLGC